MPEVKLRCLPGASTSLRVPQECRRWRCLKVRRAELFLNSCLFIEEQRRYMLCVVTQCDRNAEKGWKPPAPGDRVFRLRGWTSHCRRGPGSVQLGGAWDQAWWCPAPWWGCLGAVMKHGGGQGRGRSSMARFCFGKRGKVECRDFYMCFLKVLITEGLY